VAHNLNSRELKNLRALCEVANIGYLDYLPPKIEVSQKAKAMLTLRSEHYRNPDELLDDLNTPDRASLEEFFDSVLKNEPCEKKIFTQVHGGQAKFFEFSHTEPSGSNKDQGKIIVVRDATDETFDYERFQNFAKLAEQTDNIVVVTDANGLITWTNPGFTTLTEYELNEVIGKKPGDFLQREDVDPATKESVSQAIKNHEPITTEILNYSKSGRPYWLHMNIQPIFDDAGELISYIAIELDLTERKNYERQIEDYSKKLDLEIKTKDKFFSIIAHDLKTPFQALLGASELLKSSSDSLSKSEMADLADALHQSASSGFELLKNLLDWARSQTGALEYRPENIDMDKLIKEQINLLHEFARSKGVEVTYSIGATAAWADPGMIRTVLRNLISNALKYTDTEGTVTISAHSDDSNTVIDIKDSGTGMDAKTLASIFSVAEKQSLPGTRGETGTGLGLPIVKEFVEINGGSIDVNSAPGKGTRFTVTLPGKAT
jgi:PAS domain S-box-containing protein